ncbi:hypothetical protein SEA_PULCHRA_81 [Microbacterium phage Pulchra]|uniref:Uncharacterized protein n=3 Tax=Caudoviricetes TaxID=2731619 RepID=A0A8A5LNT3_9CAUD|nr:hypothetical protein SEA_PULCHRA_81 [Microbacterium phage Pulchra]UQT01912.1 hypothetical protein SEA_SAVANNAH_78 [Microbacterium phage Savannah]UVK58651.1 hypothetical protein SEA_CRAZYRICH_77 [Microbacterium phage CrazyRich]WNM67782.1 hypothetical protein SEA_LITTLEFORTUNE_80 [Microbacterium phage LittleFortune]
MGDTFRDGKVHVLSEKCGQCAFTPQRIVPGSRVADIVRETKDVEGAHFICHETTIAGQGDAICAGWYDRFADSDPLLRLANSMGVIDRSTQPKGTA